MSESWFPRWLKGCFSLDSSGPRHETRRNVALGVETLEDRWVPSAVAAPPGGWNNQVAITIGDKSQFEGNSGTTNFVFTVSLSRASNQTVRVNYATAPGSADGGDFTAASGSLVFNPGQRTKSVTIAVQGDTAAESDETFFVNLSNPRNAVFGDKKGVGTIRNDDTLPSLSIGDASVGEADVSSNPLTFTVSLSQASSQTVSVTFSTAPDSANSGVDFSSTGGVLVFNPGVTVQTIVVPAIGDNLYEFDETFAVNLAGAVNAGIFDGQGIGTIVDNDSPPSVSIGNDSGSENSGALSFTISLSQASGKTVTVNYATSDGAPPHGASAGSDYTATGGTVTFAPGATTATVPVGITNDNRDEFDESFSVNLSGITNALPGVTQGVGSILDDDVPTVSIGPSSQSEASFAISFTPTLNVASDKTIIVDYATADGSGLSGAVAGEDYTSVTGQFTFLPGQTVPTGPTGPKIFVFLRDENLDEFDETFAVNLAVNLAATDAAIAGPGVGTILDDDDPPSVSIEGNGALEGDGVTFTLRLSDMAGNPLASGKPVTVVYQTADGTAIQGSDYTGVTTTVTIAPGATSQQIVIDTIDDDEVESFESFSVNLTSASVPIKTITAHGSISNNDG